MRLSRLIYSVVMAKDCDRLIVVQYLQWFDTSRRQQFLSKGNGVIKKYNRLFQSTASFFLSENKQVTLILNHNGHLFLESNLYSLGPMSKIIDR